MSYYFVMAAALLLGFSFLAVLAVDLRHPPAAGSGCVPAGGCGRGAGAGAAQGAGATPRLGGVADVVVAWPSAQLDLQQQQRQQQQQVQAAQAASAAAAGVQ